MTTKDLDMVRDAFCFEEAAIKTYSLGSGRTTDGLGDVISALRVLEQVDQTAGEAEVEHEPESASNEDQLMGIQKMILLYGVYIADLYSMMGRPPPPGLEGEEDLTNEPEPDRR